MPVKLLLVKRGTGKQVDSSSIRMRLLSLFALGAFSGFSQPFTFGVTGGVPLIDFLNATQLPTHFSAISNTNRYIVGPALELHLPANLAVEFDALFRHFSYQTTVRFLDRGS